MVLLERPILLHPLQAEVLKKTEKTMTKKKKRMRKKRLQRRGAKKLGRPVQQLMEVAPLSEVVLLGAHPKEETETVLLPEEERDDVLQTFGLSGCEGGKRLFRCWRRSLQSKRGCRDSNQETNGGEEGRGRRWCEDEGTRSVFQFSVPFRPFQCL